MAMQAYALSEAQPIMAWLNPGVKVKPGSQLINKLIDAWYSHDIDLQAAIRAIGLQARAIMAALKPIPRTYHYKQSLTYKNYKKTLHLLKAFESVFTLQYIYKKLQVRRECHEKKSQLQTLVLCHVKLSDLQDYC